MARSGELEALRARVRALEGGGHARGRGVAALGPGLGARLPWGGLPRQALHEIAGPAASGVAAAFARAFLAAHGGALVWCLDDRAARRRGEPYGPGLAAFGLGPERLLLVRARDQRETLWAFEEALRSPAVACAVAELDRLDLAASRRLQLAAEAGGGAGLVLRGEAHDLAPNAALTRWRATPLPAPGAALRARLELWRAKGATPVSLEVAWDGQALLALDPAPGLADPAARPGLPPGRCHLAG